jgi:glucose-6-phosphate isomerase
MLTLDLTNAQQALAGSNLSALLERVPEVHRWIETGADPRPGRGYLGWRDLPQRITDAELAAQAACGERLRSLAPICVVAGIGGSYLGARAAIDALPGPGGARIRYAGHHVDPEALALLMAELRETEFSVVVISKSGTTTETAVAFRLLRDELMRRHGRKGTAGRIVAVTDAARGALRTLADQEGYETFVIPDDVGGRFSVLTPVGLVPIAAAGVDIAGLVAGARAVMTAAAPDPEYLPYRYAAARTALFQTGKRIEVLAAQSALLGSVCEWWQQLFGESEGKDGMGLFPARVQYTTDLHSLGQWLQDGPRNVFETFLAVDRPAAGVAIPPDPDDLDGLNYLAGRDVAEVNRAALEATRFAHLRGGVPNMTVRLERRDPHHLGALFAFFERAVAMGGYLLGVDPFTQPGVEAYKQAMFALLGKPEARFAEQAEWQQYQGQVPAVGSLPVGEEGAA